MKVLVALKMLLPHGQQRTVPPDFKETPNRRLSLLLHSALLASLACVIEGTRIFKIIRPTSAGRPGVPSEFPPARSARLQHLPPVEPPETNYAQLPD
eukprot:4515759-Amphidinium_carterae.1